MRLRGAARSPLFLRVFLLMLLCVGVVQLMNVVLLVAVRTPPVKLYTVGQIAQAIRIAGDGTGELRVRSRPAIEEAAWNPRAERIQLALAMALGVPMDRVRISFPTPFLQREQRYDRASVPRPAPLASRGAARDVVVTGPFFAALRDERGGWVTVEPARGFEPWRWFVLSWLVLSALAVIPFAWSLAQRLAKPIGAFAAAAERLGRDPRAPPLELQGPAEIAEAAGAFNRMQARLNRYVDDRATMIAAITHDLRTPLMRLGLRLERAPEPLAKACEGDLREMQAMISAAMVYVRETTQPAVRRPLDLRSLAETVIDEMSDRGAAVTLAPGDAIVVEGNALALKAVLSNLVGNAVKYAGGAQVAIERVKGHARIEVRDEGPGIAPEDMDRVFEPFYRAEPSRNRDTGGVGLGLASVRAVVRSHGGEVYLENRAGGGLCATVLIPA